MAVSWLHISDFHIKTGDPYDRDVVLDSLVKSVQWYRGQGRQVDLIFATGDIAHSGKAAEYEIATKFFDDILGAAAVRKDRLFVIPGNHDVDRAIGKKLLRTLGSEEDSVEYFLPGELKPHLTLKQASFIAWHDRYFAGIRAWPMDSTCGPIESITVNDQPVVVASLNSALFCQGEDDHAKLWMGRRCVDAAIRELPSDEKPLRIALVHHPFDWLHDTEQSNIEASLSNAFDVILRGHLHETRAVPPVFAAGAAYQTRKWPNRAMFAVFEGGTLTILPIAHVDKPEPWWPTDPSLYPREPGNSKAFPLPRLASAVASAAVRLSPLAPARTGLTNIASRIGSRFVGRTELFLQIPEALGDPQTANALILHGPPGAGKSELAREFARRNRSRYRGGLFIVDGTPAAVAVDLALLGKKFFGLRFAEDLPLLDQASETMAAIGEHPVLLIFDNVQSIESIAPWIPAAGTPCHVLITCVTDFWQSGWPSLPVEPLSRETSIELIEAVAGKAVAEVYGEKLAEAAGGLPMQLCPAAIALKHEREKGRLISARVTLTEEQQRSFGGVYDRLNADAQLFLHSIARLNPQRVLREEILIHLSEGAGWDEARFGRVAGTCEDFHLIEGTKELRMHRLFAGFIRETGLPEGLAQVRGIQATRLAEYALRVDTRPTDAEAVGRLLAFPLDVSTWADAPISGSDAHTVGRALSEIGRFQDAQPWYERAVAEKEKGDSEGRMDRQNLAVSVHQVGYCLSEQGQFAEAKPWYERAVKETRLGDLQGRVDHRSLGMALYQVGVCLSRTGQYDQAGPWYERAVEEAEKGDVYGRVDHESLGKSLHEVGSCLAQTGHYDEARPWFERAVTEAEKGDLQGRVDHESLGTSLHLVGYCLSQTGQYAAARPWYERAVAEAEKGDIHGRIDYESLGKSLDLFALCLNRAGEPHETITCLERAVAAKRKGDIFGRVDRPSIAQSLNSLARVLRKLNRVAEAEAHEREAADLTR